MSTARIFRVGGKTAAVPPAAAGPIVAAATPPSRRRRGWYRRRRRTDDDGLSSVTRRQWRDSRLLLRLSVLAVGIVVLPPAAAAAATTTTTTTAAAADASFVVPGSRPPPYYWGRTLPSRRPPRRPSFRRVPRHPEAPNVLRLSSSGSFSESFSGETAKADVGEGTEPTSTTPFLRLVPRVSRSEFRPFDHYWRTSPNGDLPFETPVVVENALSPSECERWCDALLSRAGDAVVDVQRKVRFFRQDEEEDGDEDENEDEKASTSSTEIYPMALADALDAVMDSSHDDARFAFVEGLLDGVAEDDDDDGPGSLEEMRDRMEEVREDLFRRAGREDGDGKKNDDENLFDWFPQSVRPTDCVVLAGEGATSTLHRDPFEWTGTSLCLEGTKVWRFVPPPGAVIREAMASSLEEEEEEVAEEEGREELFDRDDNGCGVEFVDEALGAYRLASVAWGDEESESGEEGCEDGEEGAERRRPLTLSAGWQSDLSLFAHRDDSSVPSARTLADLEFGGEDDDDEDGSGTPCARAAEAKRRLLESIAADPDALRPGISDAKGAAPLWTAVQHPGDVLIIPAHWWHQTYALEPSVAVASQRCGARGRDGPRVVRHVLETAKGDAAAAAGEESSGGGISRGGDLPDSLRSALSRRSDIALDEPRESIVQLFDFLKKLV